MQNMFLQTCMQFWPGTNLNSYTHSYQGLSPHLGVERKAKSQHCHCKGVRHLSAELADCSLTSRLHECAAQMRLCCKNVRRN